MSRHDDDQRGQVATFWAMILFALLVGICSGVLLNTYDRFL